MNLPSGLGVSQPIQPSLGSLGGVSGMASQIESSLQQVQSQLEQVLGALMQGYMSQIQSLMQQARNALPNAGGEAGGAGAPTGGAGLPSTAGSGEGVAGNGAIGAGGIGQIDTSGMTTQSAAGALSAYMQQNGIDPITPNQLYQLAMNPPAGTPPDVSKAAAFMLQNPDVFQAIETHDVASTDGKAGIGDMQWAAQGGLDDLQSAQSTQAAPAMSDGSPMTMQSAAGALSAYFQQQGTKSVDPNAMYQLAMDPPAGTPPDVQNAAKALLASPQAYKAIETADRAGADGLSATSNFSKAAQGEVQMPASTATASASPALEGFHPQMLMSMQGLAMNPFGATGGFGMGGPQMPKPQDDDVA
ncbi:hypothetical protein [Burkholderia glumae]|uniref:hypothetical protein n=1 Tax=Burkholderia glumae TaxID=337 RepID=UPI0014640F84|nr:hypothetical protein [Burkholderia glumae]QJP69940.1 hypothetical protein HJC54_06255 [Burkholderia glumae]